MICCIGGRPIRTPMRNWPVRAHILLPRKLRRDAPAMSGRAPRPRPSVVTVRVQIQIPPSVPGIFLQAIKEAGAMTAAHETGSAEVRSAGQEAYINGNDFAAASLSVQDSCKTPRRTRRYGMDNGFQHTLKTQPLSTRRYPLEPPFSGSSPVAPTINKINHLHQIVALNSSYVDRASIGHFRWKLLFPAPRPTHRAESLAPPA
jgi:hypothetical protein